MTTSAPACRCCEQPAPGALHLCHNQSGLRDYWAVAMLHGSPAEAPFGDTEAARVIAGTRTLHFAPGTRYSYVNQNFRILSDIVQERTGRSFAELLRTRIFDRAGMETALLAADTRAMPDGTEGYEGTPASGFRAAENRILWTGDAGLGASLDDMIAWERHIDATRDDADALYSRARRTGELRRRRTGRLRLRPGPRDRAWPRRHRPWRRAARLAQPPDVRALGTRLHRRHVQSSVRRARRGGGRARRRAGRGPAAAALPLRDTRTGSAPTPNRRPDLRSASTCADGKCACATAISRIGSTCRPTARRAAPSVRLRPARWRPVDGSPAREPKLAACARCGGAPATDVAGRYRCEELDAELTVADAGGVLYGGFSGFLGQGRMELLGPVGADVWVLPCPRALDHTPPGDWTLAFRRDGSGRVAGVEVGCWLARRLAYAGDCIQ